MSRLKTYSEQVIEYIKSAILQGKLKPGDKVNEVHIASDLSISRATLREALQTLIHDGLIIAVPQRGKFIRSLTAKDIKDSYVTGGILEGAAIAAKLDKYTDEDLFHMQALVGDMRSLSKPGSNRDQMATLDDAFHKILLSRIDNQYLVAMADKSCRSLSKFLLYQQWRDCFDPEETANRHQVLVDVIKIGSPLEVETIFRDHYAEAGDRMAGFGINHAESHAPARSSYR